MEKDMEVYNVPLAKMSIKSVPGRVDTKGIVSGVLISLAMIALMQFGERLDTLFFGGLFPVSGRVISITLIGFGAAMYGLVPGLIVAEINPFISTATGSSPIAPFFFITNGLQAVAALLANKLVKNAVSLKYCFAHSILSTFLITAAYIPLHIFYFKLPWEKLIPMYSFQGVITILIPPFLLYGLLKTVKGAGFFEE
ncbi:hypothetical protein Ga0466249_001135 [Sporomusaceae bacterium BoRhaA]|uniref:hypothetical protein n=1 Tax=Pelorhabdus rhamnosifermentans TaxID=2772457 RepID=UPI001C064203|nr:hypothetical protein [Pelorhabdus rhamnosifermentans]MBU2700043.1 hypothetical protein [Pelorhabdus rhamnosifermentans]